VIRRSLWAKPSTLSEPPRLPPPISPAAQGGSTVGAAVEAARSAAASADSFSHPVRAEVRSGSPLGVEPATGPAIPAHATDTTTSVGAEGALRSDTSTGRPAPTSDSQGCSSGVSPRTEPGEPTSTSPRTAVSPEPSSTAPVDVLPALAGAVAPSVSGPGTPSTPPGPAAVAAPGPVPAHDGARAEGAGPGAITSYRDLVDDLEEALAGAERVAPPRQFSPDTEERVDWLLRKLFEDQERINRIQAAADMRIAEVEGGMLYLASRYAEPLAEFLEGALRHARRGAKSVRLSEGLLGFRSEKGGPRVTDKAEATRWAEAHDDPTAPRFGEWVYVADPKKLVAHVVNTAEPIPGVEIREPRRLLYAQSDLRDGRGKKCMRTIQITRLATKALGAPEADEPEEE